MSFVQLYRCFLKFVNISDDVMLMSAYFYINDCEECVVPRRLGRRGVEGQIFLKGFIAAWDEL